MRSDPVSWFLWKAVVRAGVCVLVANGCDKAELHRASERVGSNIGTSRVIAKIFSEQFFAAVWSLVTQYVAHRGFLEKPPNLSK